MVEEYSWKRKGLSGGTIIRHSLCNIHNGKLQQRAKKDQKLYENRTFGKEGYINYSKSCIDMRQFRGDINVTNQSAAVVSLYMSREQSKCCK